MQTAKKRFESFFRVTPGCWEWVGGIGSHGYGGFVFGGSVWTSHRFAYSLYNGDIPTGLVVRHKCDNKLCVNPEHLLLGTLADNNKDTRDRGRHGSGKGENHGHAKLTKELAQQVKDLSLSGIFSRRAIALKYGITPGQVSGIKTGRYWKELK